MKIHRSMSAGNKRTLLLSLVVTVVLSLLPISSHATVFWDDELESGTGSPYNNLLNGPPCGGLPSYEFDTVNKISGTASLKETFPGLEYYQQCGGQADRFFTPSDDIWIRFHIRLSPGWTTSNVSTKLMRIDQTASSILKNWLVMFNGSTVVTMGAENYPDPLRATNFNTNAGDSNLRTSPEGQWVCIEAHFVNNTPDQANGIYQAYKNGVLFANYTNMEWRKTANGTQNAQWDNIRMFRQNGGGSINYDRLAVGNTRIGCLGSLPTSDTTPPESPVGLFVR